jgi:hypothetical protein
MHRLDSVGFAIEDLSALRYLRDLVEGTDYYDEIDLLTAPEDPRNLFAAGAAAAPGDGGVLTMQKLSVPAPRGVRIISARMRRRPRTICSRPRMWVAVPPRSPLPPMAR